jgi:hypothetical protein
MPLCDSILYLKKKNGRHNDILAKTKEFANTWAIQRYPKV